MKEYAIENGREVNTNLLEAEYIPDREFSNNHRDFVITTHDVAANYQNGIILLKRKNYPEFDEWWPIGGRIMKGYSIEKSLRIKTKKETDLELENIEFLGCGRCFFQTDPFGHGKGTDTLGLMYYAKSLGKISLDNLHSDFKIITPEIYPLIKGSLHPYVQDMMEKALPFLKKDGAFK